MRRPLATLVAAVLLAGLAPAGRATAATQVDVPAALSPVLAGARARSHLRVLLPDRAPLAAADGTWATGGGRRGRYDLELASAPRCGGATACFLAAFTARKTRRLGARVNVRLRGGVRGHYTPTRCGASCAPPSIAWVKRGVRYEMQIRVDVSPRGERRTLIALANSALAGGPR